MLQALNIRNFILIEELNLQFKSGLCVITGETGAGKSIILEALLFALGKKPRHQIVRNSEKITSVEVTFSEINSPEIIDYLKKIGFEFTELLSIKRTLQGNTKRNYLNGKNISLEVIEYITNILFEIYGQNNQTTLLNPATHLDILDNIGGLTVLTKECQELYQKLQYIQNQILIYQNDKDKTLNEIDYLNFSIKEISSLDIKIDEEEKLINLQQKLKSIDKYALSISEIISSIKEPQILPNIAKVLRIASRSNIDEESLNQIISYLDNAYDGLEKALQILENYMESLSSDEYSVDQVEERLSLIKTLSAKHKLPSNQFTEYLATLTKNLLELESKLIDENNFKKNLENLTLEYSNLTHKLSLARHDAANFLTKEVHIHLANLNMEKAKFEVEIISQNILPTAKGIDKVRFLASTNPGMPAGSIDKIASGGELSRLMLALKTAMLNKYKKVLNVFDEVDSGTSSTVAASIGNYLKHLSSSTHVIVITHQPQIAAKADQHILVRKEQLNNYTKLYASELTKEQRVTELARMISGKDINKHSLELAAALLN